MKNWINKIPKEKLQKYIFLGMLVLVFVAFFISLSLIEKKETPKPDDDDDQTPIDEPDDDVVAELFKMPIAGSNYDVVRKFYDRTVEDPTERQLGIINVGGAYYSSNGVSFSAKDDKAFNVLCSYGGVVKDIVESPLHGIIITISNADNVITEYSSLASTTLKKGDVVKQGDVMGVAGENEYDPAVGIHVHIRVLKADKFYNFEKLVGKETKDVK